MKQWIAIILLLLSSCGGGSRQIEAPSNPYAEQMRELSKSGVIAMQRERWDIAGRAFQRALTAARLANDAALMMQAWYNLGMMYSATARYAEAETALQEAGKGAVETGSQEMRMRARLALALVGQKQGRTVWQPEAIAPELPVDVQLAAARLVHMQGNSVFAAQLYERVLNRRANSRQQLIYRAEAHMGLAMLADLQQQGAEVAARTDRVFEITRQVGIPRLAAHAYLLRAGYLAAAQQVDAYRRAAALYRALNDRQGQRDALRGWLAQAQKTGDGEQVEQLEQQLEALEQK